MSHSRTIGLAIGAALLARAAVAQPTNFRNARLETRRIAAGELAGLMRQLSGSPGARWIGWTEPVRERRQQACCFDSWSEGRVEPERFCGRCTLEKEHESVRVGEGPGRTRLEDPGEFFVLARAERGHIERVRVFSPDCEIDAGGMAVVLLDGVGPGESVAFLGTLALSSGTRSASDDSDEDDDGSSVGHLADSCLLAIAMHAGHEADAELENLVGRSRPLAVRKKAAFWLGVSRGRAGYEILARTVPGDADQAFRRDGTFALSQSREEDATKTLVAMAHRDPAGDVRGQALFWLAQKAGRKAASAIQDSIRDDPDTDVKKKAVFALSQLPDGQGVAELIRVARTNRNLEVRKQAFFWLGQSNDARALAFLEEVLTK